MWSGEDEVFQRVIHNRIFRTATQQSEEEEETQRSERVPLVRGDSEASRGFHTPDSAASPRGFHTPVSEPSAPPSPARTPPPSPPARPLTAVRAPPSQGGPPSPSSALMTVSLEAYLEPRRISFSSPASSELARAPSAEDSYPVFSPPPVRRRHTLASPSVLQRSLVDTESRAEPHSHHTCNDDDPSFDNTFRRARVYIAAHVHAVRTIELLLHIIMSLCGVC